METFDIQVMLRDGSFADYTVNFEQDKYAVTQRGETLVAFKASDDGSWTTEENRANLDTDMQERLINQLNGFKL